MNEAERAAKYEENWKRLKNQLNKRLESDKQLAAISKKIKAGKADFSDTSRYSEIVSRHVSEVLQVNLSELTSAGKKLACEKLLSDHYDRINDVLGEVQISLDKKNNIHIKPQKADFPAGRVGKVAGSLADPTVPQETIMRRADSAVQNAAMSMHDDYIRKNAEFRSKAGLDTYIVRTDHGGCCDWCAKLAGRYRYPEEVPKDVYRRHDNCTCTVTYECGKQRQDVWSKKTWTADDETLEQRKELSEKNKPTVLTREQAKAKEKEAAQKFAERFGKKVDKGGESDIIKESPYNFKLIIGEHSINQDLTATNPNFNKSKNYQINCQRCCPTYEMRRRGFDVQALPYNTKSDSVYVNWQNIFENADWKHVGSNRTDKVKNNIIEAMKEFGDGSRAEIYVAWKRKSTHVFMCENHGGVISFIDPQTGKEDVSHYFNYIKPSKTLLCRLDNLKPTELIKECCK